MVAIEVAFLIAVVATDRFNFGLVIDAIPTDDGDGAVTLTEMACLDPGHDETVRVEPQ